jgi:hypothetical protein
MAMLSLSYLILGLTINNVSLPSNVAGLERCKQKYWNRRYPYCKRNLVMPFALHVQTDTPSSSVASFAGAV